ncbi:MAG: filamentous hemagglutinin N-terminal domain-containing protein [Elainellaceae cyanobacterium]
MVIARPVPNDTLGSDRSDIQQIRANQFRIEGGARRGSNLFHSFQDFDVPDGVAVYFANPASIETILSRLTGNSSSEILGTLGVDGMANLFLINPNGIVFGPNARLDIRGSFVASTADRFTFPDGSEFSASTPQAAPLLTVNVPIGLQYGTGMGAIANAGTLQVGRDLTLSAQQLDLQGQLQAGRHLTLVADDLRIRDRVITPFIATAGQTMRLQGNQQLDIVALNHPDSRLVAGSDLILRSPNPVIGDAHYWSGGDFRVERADGILGDFWSPIDPIIRAGGDVAFDTYRGTSLHIFAGGAVDIGSVVITGTDDAAVEGIDAIAETVTLSDGITTVAIDGRTQPTLDIRAGVNLEAITPPIGVSGSVEELTPADPLSPTRTSADITLDSVNLEAPNGLVFLTNQYQADPTLPGGTIEVDSIRTDDSLNGFAGNGGTVIVDAREGLNVGDRICADGHGFLSGYC